MSARWERITSWDTRTVYWRRSTGDHVYLAVQKKSEGWHWALRGPQNNPDGTTYVHAAGVEATVGAARRRAMLTQQDPKCPHGCRGRLSWVEDQWYCKSCRDERHPEVFPEYVFTDEIAVR